MEDGRPLREEEEEDDPLRAGGATVDAEQIEAIARREAEAQINLRPRAPRAEFARPQGNRYWVRELEGIEFIRLYSSHESEHSRSLRAGTIGSPTPAEKSSRPFPRG